MDSRKKIILLWLNLVWIMEIIRNLRSLYGVVPYWKGARVVEEARLESVYTSKAYHGFESRPFRYESPARY